MTINRRSLIALAARAVVYPAVAGTARADTRTDTLAEALSQAVTGERTWHHLKTIERITMANGGVRPSPSPGYDAAAEYVTRKLTMAGYQVYRQTFSFDDYEVLAECGTVTSPSARPLHPWMARFSVFAPEGGLTAPIMLPSSDDHGCSPTDYAGVDVKGKIVLIRHGTCFITQQQDVAASLGAAAMLMNVDSPNADINLRYRMVPPSDAHIPTATLTRGEAEQLAADAKAGPVTVTLDLRGRATSSTTFNLLADTPTGRTDNTVIMGAHLDSVDNGPGINDNISSGAVVLETACQLARYWDRVTNRVRFAWWAAEGKGIAGSQYYVDQLSRQQRENTALYLNMEMLASPNFARMVYSGKTPEGPGPAGSEQIVKLINGFFTDRGLPTVGLDLDGRSDHAGFVAAGIPSGGVNGGADTIKTPEWVELFGGTAGQMLDPCYHQPCDTTAQLNRTSFDQFGRAMAYAVGRYAVDTHDVNGK
jgi:hypothetical protein